MPREREQADSVGALAPLQGQSAAVGSGSTQLEAAHAEIARLKGEVQRLTERMGSMEAIEAGCNSSTAESCSTRLVSSTATASAAIA